VHHATDTRNTLVHTGTTTVGDQELRRQAEELDQLASLLPSYPFSQNLLVELKDRYGDWVKPTLVALRIILRDKQAYLEATTRDVRLKVSSVAIGAWRFS
jgi:hypothetical protein